LITSGTIEAPVREWCDVEPGGVGEIVVQGPITMLGYWRRPEATAETLRDGWVRTGDLAIRDEDFEITLVGRSREMYISGGENVYPAEVEAVLVEHPEIEAAAVVAIPDSEWGETGRAHIVLRNAETTAPAHLLEWLRTKLARFKVPREIIVEEELPRTASGKIQKHRLAPDQLKKSPS
jgi:acyl-CoA synthetase (AMP-forming)/AMP-acid ligase II